MLDPPRHSPKFFQFFPTPCRRARLNSPVVRLGRSHGPGIRRLFAHCSLAVRLRWLFALAASLTVRLAFAVVELTHLRRGKS
jgi:hypothetical protein